MKLLNYTSKYLAFLLLAVITLWALAFYYAMLDEIYDSLDDGLENQKILLLKRAKEDPGILDNNDFNKHVYSFTPIQQQQYENHQERYQDTLMYMINEEDFEPVRIYESTLKAEGRYYKLKIITSMVEEDDLIEDLVSYLIGLYFILVLSILVLNNLLLKRIWKPFYDLIAQLKSFNIEQKPQITLTPTAVEEFNLLNTTVSELINSAHKSYNEQKQFIENASHELQTPLAISINKLELFLEKNSLTDDQLMHMASVLDNLGRLTRLNKSLLLLSKIENKQFQEAEPIDFNVLAQECITDFKEIAIHKGIDLKLHATDGIQFKMNKDLARILLTNLIKNALVHGKPQNPVTLSIANKQLKVRNTGTASPLDAELIFARFKKIGATEKSTGLGLPIARAIAEKYNLTLRYTFDGEHTFTVQFPK
ncbi:signal transduction histidine kinase [Leeuwenhoekiella aestuarii]|uniref:sensor histidine kinase n=1 Tax=Leeuwenhoekiella aestuarii TaxID=2249426 RepID=UPI000FFF55F6|nr:HAMP domain-containing sensor histidine kinase [Leeuwenhoekiella aestuarii]RXG15040.1 signal transduction histidine kinase [Leeuwenhoekiella aestuarii]